MISKICGHRGAAFFKPENTIPSFQWCVENNISWAECDVQLTKDDIPIIFHDESLFKVSNKKNIVKDMFYQDTKSIDVGSWFSKRYCNERIPSLVELLLFSKTNNLNLNLELKFYEPINFMYRKKLVRSVISAINKTQTNNQILISSFDFNSLEYYRQLSTKTHLGLLFETLPENWEKKANKIGVSTIHLDYTKTSEYQIKEISKKSFKPFVYTCNNPKKIEKFWDFGLSGVITDNPIIFE